VLLPIFRTVWTIFLLVISGRIVKHAFGNSRMISTLEFAYLSITFTVLVCVIFFLIMSLYKWPLLDGPVSGLRNFRTIYTVNHKFRVKWVPFHHDKPRG